jgi:transmembrane sensor
VSDRLRDEALRWQVCLWSGEVTAAERARFERWHQRSAAHQQAWQQVRRFGLCLEGLAGGTAAGVGAGAGAGAGPDAGPSAVRRPAWDDGHAAAVERGTPTAGSAAPAGPAGGSPGAAAPSSRQTPASLRRRLLGAGLVLGGGTALWRGLDPSAGGRLAAGDADHRTAVGQWRAWTLADGSQLHLGTATAVDVDPVARTLRLHEGELLLAPGPDPLARGVTGVQGGAQGEGEGVRGAWTVRTPAGEVFAPGARVSVRHVAAERGQGSRLQVHAGAAVVRGHGPAAPRRVPAAAQCWWTAGAIGPLQPLPTLADAWTRGLLAVERQPLGELLAELGRYRAGWLRWDAAVARWPVSGVFALQPVDAALEALVQVLPLRLQRLGPWWVSVRAA